MHLVMQYLPFDTPARPDAVKEYVQSLVQRRLLTTEQGESINALQIAKFLASDLCRQMRGGYTGLARVPLCAAGAGIYI